MKYRRVTELTEEEASGLRFNPKMDQFVLKNSPYKWLVSRDDDTILLLGGLYFVTPLNRVPYIWFVPTENLRPKDVRGMRKLLTLLHQHHPGFAAIIDEEHTAAVRTATHLGFTRQTEGIYTWQISA
jgi:hypothetical protein